MSSNITISLLYCSDSIGTLDLAKLELLAIALLDFTSITNLIE